MKGPHRTLSPSQPGSTHVSLPLPCPPPLAEREALLLSLCPPSGRSQAQPMGRWGPGSINVASLCHDLEPL